ncbi:extracellular solute-binding protein [Nakamurella silvestris]|nr:extracellular solute-binding protein [Nakamurella silvestris]
MKRTTKLAALTLAGSLALAACGSSNDGDKSSATSPAPTTNAVTSDASTAAPTDSSEGSPSETATAPTDTSSSGNATGDPALSAEISILAPSYADSSKSDWEAMITGFNGLYPNVKVNLQIEAWDGFSDKVQTRIQGNDLPDILNDNNYADYAKNDLLYPITDVMSPDTFASIVPSLAKNGLGTDGVQWAAPDIASARTLVYNNDLFKQAGLTEAPKTWDELLADAQAIQALGGGISGYGMPLGKEEAQVEASLWIWGNGGDWVDADGKITANSPANIAAFEEIKKFIDGKAVQPDAGATNRQAVADLFNQGKLGMYVTHPGLIGETRTKFPDIKYTLAPTPSKDGTTPVSLGVTDFILAFNNKDDAKKAATKAFLDYMYTPDVYQKWAAGTGLLPVTEGAIKLQAEATPEDKPFFDALPGVRFLPQSNPGWSALQSALQASAGEIATKDAAATLNDIQAQVDAQG